MTQEAGRGDGRRPPSVDLSGRGYLVWNNIAYETGAHLLANGAMLPVDTRIMLSRLRDLAEAMSEEARRALAEPLAGGTRPASGLRLPVPAPRVAAEVAPEAAADAAGSRAHSSRRGYLARQAPALALLAGAVLLALAGKGPGPAPLPPAPAVLAAALPVLDLLPPPFAPLDQPGRPALPDRPAAVPAFPAQLVAYPREAPPRRPESAETDGPALLLPARMAPNPLYAAEAEAILLAARPARVEMQRRLGLAGYHAGAVDGVIGARTRRALLAWQAEAGLQPTGYADAETLARLRAGTEVRYADWAARARARKEPPPAAVAAAEPAADANGCPVAADGGVVYYHSFYCDLVGLKRALQGAKVTRNPESPAGF